MIERHPLQILRILEEAQRAVTLRSAGRDLPSVLRSHNCTATELKRLQQEGILSYGQLAAAFDDAQLALDYIHEKYDDLSVEKSAGCVTVTRRKDEMYSEKEVNEIGALIIEEPNQSDEFFAELSKMSIGVVRIIRRGAHRRLDDGIRKKLRQIAGLEPSDKDSPAQSMRAETKEHMPVEQTTRRPPPFTPSTPFTPATLSVKEIVVLLRAKMHERNITELKIPIEGEILATYSRQEKLDW